MDIGTPPSLPPCVRTAKANRFLQWPCQAAPAQRRGDLAFKIAGFLYAIGGEPARSLGRCRFFRRTDEKTGWSCSRSFGIGNSSSFFGLVAFSAANRFTPRIKSGAGFRRKMLYARPAGPARPAD